MPQLSVLLGKEGQKPAAERMALRWTTADVLSADIPLRGEQTLLASLELPGVGRAMLPPVCLPYSPEFAPRPEGEGLRTLERLAQADRRYRAHQSGRRLATIYQDGRVT